MTPLQNGQRRNGGISQGADAHNSGQHASIDEVVDAVKVEGEQGVRQGGEASKDDRQGCESKDCGDEEGGEEEGE